jgi:leucyl aminopeptidase (aminopeptidase T)
MNVRCGERVLIISDRDTSEIAEALRKAAEEVVAGKVESVLLEDYGSRPMSTLPDEIEQLVRSVDVTLYAAQFKRGEFDIRMQITKAAVVHGRYGSMPGVTRSVMEQGMCADYNDVAALTGRLFLRLKGTRQIHVQNLSGSDVTVQFNPSWRWIRSDGMYHQPGQWGNLPEGEVFTAPYRLEGYIVADVVGDWFAEKYGVLSQTPVSLRVHDSLVDLDTVRCQNEQIRNELVQYLQTDENSNRAAEFSIGTNTFVKEFIGNIVQDEKAPTVHIAFGLPYPEETGADWTSVTHVDLILSSAKVLADGQYILDAGKFNL